MLLDIFILEGVLESEMQSDNKEYLRLYSGRKKVSRRLTESSGCTYHSVGVREQIIINRDEVACHVNASCTKL